MKIKFKVWIIAIIMCLLCVGTLVMSACNPANSIPNNSSSQIDDSNTNNDDNGTEITDKPANPDNAGSVETDKSTEGTKDSNKDVDNSNSSQQTQTSIYNYTVYTSNVTSKRYSTEIIRSRDQLEGFLTDNSENLAKFAGYDSEYFESKVLIFVYYLADCMYPDIEVKDTNFRINNSTNKEYFEINILVDYTRKEGYFDALAPMHIALEYSNAKVNDVKTNFDIHSTQYSNINYGSNVIYRDYNLPYQDYGNGLMQGEYTSQIIRSKQQLEEFFKYSGGVLQETKQYDETFFENKYLVFIYYYAHSMYPRVSVTNVNLYSGTLNVDILVEWPRDWGYACAFAGVQVVVELSNEIQIDSVNSQFDVHNY